MNSNQEYINETIKRRVQACPVALVTLVRSLHPDKPDVSIAMTCENAMQIATYLLGALSYEGYIIPHYASLTSEISHTDTFGGIVLALAIELVKLNLIPSGHTPLH